jgi:MOSC domain-containing protein YiiM
MKLVSVNCGLPRDVVWRGKNVTTSIFKEPIPGRMALRTLNLDGDRQSDLSVQGGKHKAVYCYPIEHYEYWKAELPDHPLPLGAFGENFTFSGLSEDSVSIGDRFSLGSAEVVVSQPRLPCYKLGIRFESDGIVKKFLASRRTGFYLAVVREGMVSAGDEITVLRHPNSISVSEINRLLIEEEYDKEDLRLSANGSRPGSIARELEGVLTGKGDNAERVISNSKRGSI